MIMTPDAVAALLSAERERLLKEVEDRGWRLRNIVHAPEVSVDTIHREWDAFLGWLKGLRGDANW